ncbi:MAG: JAB domain-containing protein [Candidatus Thiodiazotropha sp.]
MTDAVNIVQLPLLEINRFEGLSLTDLNPIEHNAVIRLALDIMKNRYARGKKIESIDDAIRYLQLLYGEKDREIFSVVLCDNHHRVIEIEELFLGTIDGASVYPREVVKAALMHNAAAVLLVHNHPSGIAEPSKADKVITDRLCKAFSLVDVRVLDHIIVTFESSVSFAQRGLM